MCNCEQKNKIDQVSDNRTVRLLAFISILLFIVVGMASCIPDPMTSPASQLWTEIPAPAESGLRCWVRAGGTGSYQASVVCVPEVK